MAVKKFRFFRKHCIRGQNFPIEDLYLQTFSPSPSGAETVIAPPKLGPKKEKRKIEIEIDNLLISAPPDLKITAVVW